MFLYQCKPCQKQEEANRDGDQIQTVIGDKEVVITAYGLDLDRERMGDILGENQHYYHE